MNTREKLEWFQNQKHKNRFWWFQSHDYLPDIYATLTDKEFELLQDWFDDTEKSELIGEVNIPAMSTMLGMINGSGLDSILQLGHFAGYSSLFFGWALEKMGGKLLSIDINHACTNFTDYWIHKARLGTTVYLATLDSTSEQARYLAMETLGSIKAIFIDSSHQYANTLLELESYYSMLAPGGVIFLHDVSMFATKYDKTGQGGVFKAILEWTSKEPGLSSENIMLNRWIEGKPEEQPLTIWDGCGLGIIQKPTRK